MINILLIIAIVFSATIIIMYNKLIHLKNNVKKSEAGIDVVLKQRFDLIPNLVECVKGYSEHEATTLEEIVEQRTAYSKNGEMDIKQAEEINRKFNNVMAVVENYPDLKASSQYTSLQSSLARIEDKLQIARNTYNSEVTKYNTAIETVPTNLIAKLFAFEKSELFTVDETTKENIDINV